MWKREKIGSTTRLGPDSILPQIVIDGQSLTKIVNKLLVGDNFSTIEDVTLNWLLDKSFKMSSYTDQIHKFSWNEIDSETLNRTKSSSLKTLKIAVQASLKSQDHLPSKGLKAMLNCLWKFLEKSSSKDKFSSSLGLKKGAVSLESISELLKMDVIFPSEFSKSFLTLYYNKANYSLQTNYYSIVPNISFDIYQIKSNNYSISGFKSLFACDALKTDKGKYFDLSLEHWLFLWLK